MWWLNFIIFNHMRKCKKCGADKPLNNFQIADPRRGYRRHECDTCYRDRHRSYYRAKEGEYKERVKRTYVDWRDIVIDAYGAKCACCGEVERRFLTVDHVNNDGSKRRKMDGKGRRLYRMLVKENFPPNFQILCFNCNIGRFLNGGVCPHKEGSTIIPEEGVGPSGPKRAAPAETGDDMICSCRKRQAA